jgi:hypothetical protein
MFNKDKDTITYIYNMSFRYTDRKSQDKKSQFKFCILTKHIGQKVTT